MKIAITGGSGYLGQFLVDHFDSEGFEVIATSTDPLNSAVAQIKDRIEWHQWRLRDPINGFGFLEDCDYLIHAAFDHVPGKYRGGEGSDPLDFMKVNFLGSVELFNQARKFKVKRTVFISSRAVFGEVGPATLKVPISDDQAPFPDTYYGLYKHAVERISGQFTDIGLCSIRPTGVYGITAPIERTKWFDICRDAHQDLGKNKSDQARTEVHGQAVARAINILIRAPQARVVTRSFNCSDIALSPSQLRSIVHQVRAGADFARIINELPMADPPHHDMDCDGLRRLGWKKDGLQKVVEEIRSLVALI